MELRIYDTLRRDKVVFTPITPGKVSFYTCGVTVYDYSHVGHARVYVTTDVMRRVFESLGYAVTYVQNFTDIDDKIIKRSAESGIGFHELTAQFIDAYMTDLGALGVRPADYYPRATDYVIHMIEMIEILLKKNHAYLSDQGDVWYSVASFDGYGKLSKKKMDELIAGARGDVTPGKRDAADFVLWKSVKPGEPSWPSPWGPGRPGWHIECSAMAREILGDTIDIHAGGADLIFPHHENEICQSESVSDKQFVRYWIHNGFVTIDNEKMSKSVGNFFAIRDVLTQVDGQVLRFFLLKSHYRMPLHYSLDGLKEAGVALEKLTNTARTHANSPACQESDAVAMAELHARFWSALTDDFNFPEAVGVLFDMSRLINTLGCCSSMLVESMEVLGLTLPIIDTISPEILAIMERRWAAKQNREFALADQLRIELIDHHQIVVEDSKTEYRWKKVSKE